MSDPTDPKATTPSAGESRTVERDQEVDRILQAFPGDPWSILGLKSYEVDPKEIKLKFRKLSLLIHPDKTQHPRAQDAFDLVKKAQVELGNEERMVFLEDVVKEARYGIEKGRGVRPGEREKWWGPEGPGRTDETVIQEMRVQVEQILTNENRRKERQAAKDAELEAQMRKRAEAEAVAKKRKAEEQKAWEEDRERRVGGWRQFCQSSSSSSSRREELGGEGGGRKKKTRTSTTTSSSTIPVMGQWGAGTVPLGSTTMTGKVSWGAAGRGRGGVKGGGGGGGMGKSSSTGGTFTFSSSSSSSSSASSIKRATTSTVKPTLFKPPSSSSFSSPSSNSSQRRWG
ncbi:MAG: hypothetical protein DHS80DRAFT_28917 [Piptocephalis tieghemiana]|nr:MAG: hypothetical protein DHS80DRAFT_28917 [Piptocephalis tieghemiana]